jgi:hypothetical protein
VAVEPAFLNEHVERLADGGAAHVEPGAQPVLGGDALAVAAEVLADGVGDLEVAWNAGPVVQEPLPNRRNV